MKKTILLNLVVLLVTSALAPAATRLVPSQYPTIQAGIDAAVDGDTVIVADGTYTGPGNSGIDFLGKAITVRSESGPENCIIDCKAKLPYRPYAFYFRSGEDANSVVDGFTITNARGGGHGGAIICIYSSPTIINCIISNNKDRGVYCREANPTIENCTIIGNSAKYDGGGMYNCNNSSPTLTNCTFSGNSAEYDGGGIYCSYDSNPTINDCTINSNSAEHGGGIYCREANPTIENCTIIGNSAKYDGGGIVSFNSSLTLNSSTISGNSTNLYGGAIFSLLSSLTIANCIISDNSSRSGGGISCIDSSTTITNCTFSGNSAKDDGGGIYLEGRYVRDTFFTIINCTISNNTADRGGGICYHNSRTLYSSPIITNCTFAGNSSRFLGNALACDSYNRKYPSNLQITNCIFWDGGDEIWNRGNSTITITYSDVQGGWPEIYDPREGVVWGAGNIDADPCFVLPGYWDANGTPEDANDDFWVDGDYHLLEDSPCINAGDPNYLAGPNETDIDGEPRVWDGRVDMGADEFVPMIEVQMKFTPQALNPGSKGKWMKAHFVLPEGFMVEDVDVSRPAWIEPLSIESEYMNIFINEDGLVEIEAAFSRAEFCAAGEVAAGGPIDGTVTVIGVLTTGQYFYGTDTIKIVTNNLGYLGVLASHWLEQDCGKPDWCSGLDLDQDSIVNFVDFAMFDGCCIEIIKK